MIRGKLLKSCFALLIIASPAYAVGEQLSSEVKELFIKTIGASFQAASACYSVQNLLFSTIEAKGRGATKEAALAAATSKTKMRPETYAAIELAFEVDKVTDQKVDELYANCLKKAKAELDGAFK